MKAKTIVLIVGSVLVGFILGVSIQSGVAQSTSVENIWNSIFDSTAETIKIIGQ